MRYSLEKMNVLSWYCCIGMADVRCYHNARYEIKCFFQIPKDLYCIPYFFKCEIAIQRKVFVRTSIFDRDGLILRPHWG